MNFTPQKFGSDINMRFISKGKTIWTKEFNLIAKMRIWDDIFILSENALLYKNYDQSSYFLLKIEKLKLRDRLILGK